MPWLNLESSLGCMLRRTVKPVLSGHSKRRPKIGFQDRLLLNAGQKYCRMLSWSILQYISPSLSYFLSLRPLFCLFLSGRFTQVLLYFSTKTCVVGTQKNTHWLVCTCVVHKHQKTGFLASRPILSVPIFFEIIYATNHTALAFCLLAGDDKIEPYP